MVTIQGKRSNTNKLKSIGQQIDSPPSSPIKRQSLNYACKCSEWLTSGERSENEWTLNTVRKCNQTRLFIWHFHVCTLFFTVSLSSAWWASSDSCSKTQKYDFGLGAVEGILEDQSCVLFVVECCLITSLRALPPSSCVFVLLMSVSVYTIIIIYSAS